MSTLPIEPTECDRERFRDWTKAMQFGLEYDRHGDDYKYVLTDLMFRLWWAVERERQLLQNLNMSQGCKMSELAQELEAERKRLDWALKKQAYYARNPDRLWVDVGTGNHKWFAVNDDSPRATIDKLIAGEPK